MADTPDVVHTCRGEVRAASACPACRARCERVRYAPTPNPDRWPRIIDCFPEALVPGGESGPIFVRVEFLPGENLEDAILSMLVHVKTTGVPLVAKFNDMELRVFPTDTFDSVVARMPKVAAIVDALRWART